jgi:hypothetical protein
MLVAHQYCRILELLALTVLMKPMVMTKLMVRMALKVLTSGLELMAPMEWRVLMKRTNPTERNRSCAVPPTQIAPPNGIFALL